jgi:hypothetical protein
VSSPPFTWRASRSLSRRDPGSSSSFSPAASFSASFSATDPSTAKLDDGGAFASVAAVTGEPSPTIGFASSEVPPGLLLTRGSSSPSSAVFGTVSASRSVTPSHSTGAVTVDEIGGNKSGDEARLPAVTLRQKLLRCFLHDLGLTSLDARLDRLDSCE